MLFTEEKSRRVEVIGPAHQSEIGREGGRSWRGGELCLALIAEDLSRFWVSILKLLLRPVHKISH